MVKSFSVWHKLQTIKSFGKCGLVPIDEIGHGQFNMFLKISECLKTCSKNPNKLNQTKTLPELYLPLEVEGQEITLKIKIKKKKKKKQQIVCLGSYLVKRHNCPLSKAARLQSDR